MKYEVLNESDKEYYDGKYFLVSTCYMPIVKVYSSYEGEALELYGFSLVGSSCVHSGDEFDSIFEECDKSEDILYETYYPVNGGEYWLDIRNLCMKGGIDL